MFELRLLAPEDRVEWLSDALEALDALSVSVEDADAQTDAEQALFGEPGMPPPRGGWNRSRVIALFGSEAAATEASALLQAQDDFDGCAVARLPPSGRCRTRTGCVSRNRSSPRWRSRPSSGSFPPGMSRLRRPAA